MLKDILLRHENSSQALLFNCLTGKGYFIIVISYVAGYGTKKIVISNVIGYEMASIMPYYNSQLG